MDVPAIETRRLVLTSMSPAVMTALLEGRRDAAAADVGAEVPSWWPDQVDIRFLRLRVGHMARDPDAQPWLVRAMVVRGGAMVGHCGFHGPPEDGVAELGYAVFPPCQGRGYAKESAAALIAWAAAHDVARVRASVAPGNEPSLAIVRGLGFAQVGEQWDEEDGLELVFERQAVRR